MSEPAVHFHRTTKTFGPVRAVDGLDLTVRRGEMVAVLGPNGAGKTTTVNLLLGLLRPTGGDVTVLGHSPAVAVAAGGVGAMLQDGGLMPGVTVAGLIGLARDLYPRPRPLADILTEADLTGIADRRVDRLSGGQTQRLRFALAIAGDPELLVLDEPTTAMDVESRQVFWTNVRGYAARGTTVLFTTHYLTEADENADRILVVARGQVVVDGTPAEVKATAGEQRVRFTLGESELAGLDALPCVTGIEVRGASVTLRTTNAETTVRALLTTRPSTPDLEVTGADLEEAFLALTH
ncbi:MAG TPA: ABC transporter ATP-binding protein [Pseudonocardiaceae bacterium]|jgi:ABC-2 type transport system ATP-binding protein|nr:ABC transporter ATP-binding protein [Pseudonocardiaceae bacterium]